MDEGIIKIQLSDSTLKPIFIVDKDGLAIEQIPIGLDGKIIMGNDGKPATQTIKLSQLVNMLPYEDKTRIDKASFKLIDEMTNFRRFLIDGYPSSSPRDDSPSRPRGDSDSPSRPSNNTIKK